MNQEFQVVHFAPGRLRVRLAAIRNDPAFGPQLEAMLSSVHGIRSVRTRDLTGSLLVEYDPDGLDLDSLLALGRMMNLIPEELDLNPHGLAASGAGTVADGALAAAGRVGDLLSTALAQGGKMAVSVLDPRVAVPAVAFNAVARRLGLGLALQVSPAVAAVLVLASVLLSTGASPGPAKPGEPDGRSTKTAA